ncbi:Protein dopey [Exophiala dermatitidis]|uniref:Uncharacterized protein n=1 Tax=Exophiala dermatitidis (strain ATCC 34100 / CBS 525.76 / NIH/UT8656) TaxID=858893 RepID=H6C2Z8_EXODN|nr:uncharacterized protein HMPREF1120_06031 [Exophiala dermatitidis NIH/UT8656]EHY58013.1 hypothetical protein HMPREF1120_06031 [Exophiala dermatitidis NIH/UT8656]
MAADPKAIRRYHAGVERALALFDATNEWADYIAFLSRLAKTLQASPPAADIPMKPALAKYLALCMKPSLPSGVHQKALEVYSLVFTLLGQEGLSHDLPIWLPGFSHTLTFASLSTRPLFLSLYDEHILKLPSHVLRPALRALILSLLPGIEEENSEDFEHTLGTFNRLRQLFVEDDSEELFWQSLFLASVTSKSRRPGALVYLTRQLPKLGPSTTPSSGLNGTDGDVSGSLERAIKAVTTPEPGLLVRCFATGLQDEQALIQRGFLDLLVSHLPLSASILQTHIPKKDLDVLVTSALSVVLRRDMSLNRRLWTWFIDKEDNRDGAADVSSVEPLSPSVPGGEAHTSAAHSYFEKYGLQSVIRSLEKMLRKESASPIDRARPFRIMLSLMDRWVIGKLPIQALFIVAMQDLRRYQTLAPSQASFDEVFRSANVFFDAIEPQLITSQLFQLLEMKQLDLLDFIMSNFNLQDDEMTAVHLPLLCLAVSEMTLQSKVSDSDEAGEEAEALSKLLEGLLALLPPHPVSPPSTRKEGLPHDGWLTRIKALYQKSSYVRKALTDIISPGEAAELLLRNVALVFLDCLTNPSRRNSLTPLTNALVRAISRCSTFQPLRQLEFGEQLHTVLQNIPSQTWVRYEVARSIAVIVDTLHTFDPHGETLTKRDLYTIIPALVSQFWSVLLPRTPQYHVEAVEQIWKLRIISQPLLLVDSKIMELMCEGPSSLEDEQRRIAHFSTFWLHTRFPEINVEIFSTSHGFEDDDVPWALLRQPVLSIIDGVDPHQPDDPRRVWLNNLPSMLPVFTIIYTENNAATNPQLSILGLCRLHKVIVLARQSTVQRNEIFASDGVSSMILDLCTEKLSSSESEASVKLVLSILNVIIEETDVRALEELVVLLMQRLINLSEDNFMQESVLDTLQTIFAKPNSRPPPGGLLAILMTGITSDAVDSTIDKWITVLCNTISLYTTQTLFSNMLKLTACFCRRIKTYFAHMKLLYQKSEASGNDEIFMTAKTPERSLGNLLAGLEYILARAHTHLVDQSTGSETASITNTSEKSQARSIANHRLTVILCMQDTIKLCGEIWAWRISKRSSDTVPDTKSFAYISARLRTRTRRILEHLTDAEPQECLETLMGMWVETARRGSGEHNVALNLMQSLDGARPKFMMPATFNAIYNRTNPSALDQSQKSSLSVDVSAPELMAFLIAYTKALEDDLLEEIWTDCTTFLREVLANPMPHRQILLRLLEFVAVICQKMENTNFGEVVRMRRELADLCARLFTAIFTIKPAGLDGTASSQTTTSQHRTSTSADPLDSRSPIRIICEAMPIIGNALGDLERLNTTMSGIAMHITGPALRSRQFPESVTIETLHLVQLMAKSQPNNNKTWKKDVLDAFNDAKFFQSPPSLAGSGWMPLLKQVWQLDKGGLIAELLSRLTPPATAGIMFGVGATAARTEADRKTQLTLRRIALLLLSVDIDALVAELSSILLKMEELLTATVSSSPSSATRADVYLVFRAIALTFSHVHLVSVWPIVDAELRDIFTNIRHGQRSQGEHESEEAESKLAFTPSSQLQGAKLLDLLLLLKPEEFQLHEWLFVTDTVDAVYPPPPSSGFEPTALADQIVSVSKSPNLKTEVELPTLKEDEPRKPWLCTDLTRTSQNPQAVLIPFLRQLSIHAFEDTYSLQPVDVAACRQDLLADLFVD